MSNFRLNSAMANFLRLEDAADFYDVCLRHWTTACALIPAPAHRIVSERHVDDVGAEIGPLLDWLGLAQSVEMLDDRKTALKRGLITTASYSQVTEPINQRAAGRWQRYRRHLDPVLDVLAPWAVEFGHPDPRQSKTVTPR